MFGEVRKVTNFRPKYKCEPFTHPGWRLRDIQRWSVLIQKYFSSVSALNSADFLWNSADILRIQNDNFWYIFHFFFKTFLSTSISKQIILVYSHICILFFSDFCKQKLKTLAKRNKFSQQNFFPNLVFSKLGRAWRKKKIVATSFAYCAIGRFQIKNLNVEGIIFLQWW